MIIYGATLSPFVRKAVVFAMEKGIDFKLVPTGGPATPSPTRPNASSCRRSWTTWRR